MEDSLSRCPDCCWTEDLEGNRYRSAVTAPDVFSAKTSRLARVLLSHRDRRWTQEELTERTGLSRGLISRALN